MSPTEIAVDDVRKIIVEAPTAAHGLDKVLALSGCWLPPETVGALVLGLAQYDVEPHVSRVREPVKLWRDDRYQPTMKRTLRERMLREVDRLGAALAAQPLETLHSLPEHVGPLMDLNVELPSCETPLTAEQVAELPDDAWIEIRLSAPIRPLGEPA